MVDEIISQCDIGAMLYNVSTTATKAQKRWRRSIFSIRFTNTLLGVIVNERKTSGIITTPSSTAPEIIPQATNSDDHGPLFASIDQSELNNLVQNKDLELLHKFNGVKGLAESLNTNLKRGISTSSHDIQTRKIVFGSNTYKLRPPLKGFVYFLVEAFKEPTILILLTSAALSLGFGIKENGAKQGWHEGGGILVSVFLVNTVSALSNLRREKHFGRLSEMNNINVETDVIREGRRQKIPTSRVVVGDVVVLSTGDQIPVDGLFIDGYSLLVDQSRISGEIHHINIDVTEHPFLFSGSKVAYGDAQMLVTSVGMNTSWGKMMSSVTNDSNYKQTPRRSSLIKLASWIAMLGLVGTLLDLLITSIRYGTRYTKDENGNWEFNEICTDTNDILNSFVNVGVSTSEGLLLAINLTHSCSIERMMADQAMVRKKSACEAMGSVNVICTDKTGVLTLNSMKVDEFWIGLHLIKEVDLSGIIDTRVLQLYHEGVGLNTSGRVYKSVTEYSGSPTEKAILSWAVRDLGMDMEKVKQDSTILHVETFNPEKKRSGVSIRKKEDNTIHVHWKGAAETVLAMCSKYYQQNGLVKSINHEEKTQLENIIQGMAASSLRCIAFAHKEDATSDKTINEQGLTLLGIVGIKDPCRREAREAIDTCRSAGVEIKMITRDNVFTAKAIATECGILEACQHVSEGEVIEGEEFRNYTDDERMEKVESIKVMARSSPSDKLLMVQCLKRKGHVVAVTGHSTDDVPALKEADIGLSMGIQGTDVAKENSDIVILNDDIRSVVMVLMQGQCVYNNIQKFIQFQFTANALVINFVKAASAGGIPLIPVQQLWINLIINISGSLALTTEPPTKELMHQPHVGRDAHAPLITNVMWRNLLAQSVYQIVIPLTFQFRGRSFFKVSKRVNNTIIFNTFVLCQVFNIFNSRKLEKMNVLEGLHKNRVFIGVIGVTIILQVVMVEFLNNFAGTEKLNWEQWGTCIAIAAVSLPIGWIVKLIPVPDRPFVSYLQEWSYDTEQATGPQSNIQMFNKPKTL